MKRAGRSLLLLSVFNFLLVSAAPSLAADDIVFAGTVKRHLPLGGGVPCSSISIAEQHELFGFWVGFSRLPLEAFDLEEGKLYWFSGEIEVRDACNLLVVTRISETPLTSGTYDSTTETLHIPEVSVDGQARFEVDLGPPFNILNASYVDSISE